MTRLTIYRGDVVRYQGKEWEFAERDEAQIRFCTPSLGEPLVIDDAALATAIGRGDCVLVRGQSSCRPTRPSPAASIAFNERPEAKKAKARLRLAYVMGAKADALAFPVTDDELGASITNTAFRVGDPNPPCTRSLRRWMVRGGTRPNVLAMADNDAAKGNRIRRIDPDVDEIIEARIDNDYLRRPPITMVELHARIEHDVNLYNSRHAIAVPIPSYDAVAASVNRRSPRDIAEARQGKAYSDRKFSSVSRQPNAEAPLDYVELDHTALTFSSSAKGQESPSDDRPSPQAWTDVRGCRGGSM